MEIKKLKLSKAEMNEVSKLNSMFSASKIINPNYMESRERGIAKLKITWYVNQSIFESRRKDNWTLYRNRVIAEFAGCSIRWVRKVFALLQIQQFLQGVSRKWKNKKLYLRKLIGVTAATQHKFVELLLDTQWPKYNRKDSKENPNLPDPVETKNFYAIEL